MGLFGRVANLFRGFISLFISGMEEQNPEVVFDMAISKRIEQYQKLTKAVSGIVYLRNKLEKEYQDTQAKLASIQKQIPVAVENDEQESAVYLIEQRNTLTATLEHLATQLERTRNEAEEAKAGLITFQGEIEKLKSEKIRKLAEKENAEARIKIQQQLSGLSTDSDIEALDNVRESIEKTRAQADVGSEMQGANIQNKLQNIEKESNKRIAQQEFEEMKKQMAAKKEAAQNTEKTL